MQHLVYENVIRSLILQLFGTFSDLEVHYGCWGLGLESQNRADEEVADGGGERR